MNGEGGWGGGGRKNEYSWVGLGWIHRRWSNRSSGRPAVASSPARRFSAAVIRRPEAFDPPSSSTDGCKSSHRGSPKFSNTATTDTYIQKNFNLLNCSATQYTVQLLLGCSVWLGWFVRVGFAGVESSGLSCKLIFDGCSVGWCVAFVFIGLAAVIGRSVVPRRRSRRPSPVGLPRSPLPTAVCGRLAPYFPPPRLLVFLFSAVCQSAK